MPRALNELLYLLVDRPFHRAYVLGGNQFRSLAELSARFFVILSWLQLSGQLDSLTVPARASVCDVTA